MRYLTHQKLSRRLCIVVAMFSQFFILDVTLINKLLKNDKLLKLCYVVEDYENLKTDDWNYQGSDWELWRFWRHWRTQATQLTLSRFWPKVLKFLNLALYFFTSCFNHLLLEANEFKDKIKWERDKIVHSTNWTSFPLPDFMGKDNTIHHTCHWIYGGRTVCNITLFTIQ